MTYLPRNMEGLPKLGVTEILNQGGGGGGGAGPGHSLSLSINIWKYHVSTYRTKNRVYLSDTGGIRPFVLLANEKIPRIITNKK